MPTAGAEPVARSSGGTRLPVEQIGFGYAITGFVGGFNGDQNRASSVLRGLQRTPAMGGADGAATMAAAMKGTAPPARL